MAATPSPPRQALAKQVFADRRQAGRELARRLRGLVREQPVVLALPRGGIPVAHEIAAMLGAPLDVLVARKIGAPGNPELGIGALAEDDVRVLSEEAIAGLHIDDAEIERAAAQAAREVADGVRRYRGGRPPPLRERTAVIVDDGLATGGTALAAVRAARRLGACRVVLAVPVGAPASVRLLEREADAVICLLEPQPLWAIGMWYEDFSQVSDEEVSELLGHSAA